MNTITPVKVDILEDLLTQYNYNTKETKFLIDGFTNGFEIGYKGDREVQQLSKNLRLDCGSPCDIWNKMMKEVKLKRFAGPFERIPFPVFYSITHWVSAKGYR